MGIKATSNINLTDTLTLSEVKGKYWLYDYTRGMNLAMNAKTPQDAFVKALSYYQSRTKQVENELTKLSKAVESFVDSVTEKDEY